MIFEPDNMKSVVSSNVESVGYDAVRQDLYVRFRSGGLYIYRDVSESVYQELLSAPSVGSYLNRNIKNNYPYERIE